LGKNIFKKIFSLTTTFLIIFSTFTTFNFTTSIASALQPTVVTIYDIQYTTDPSGNSPIVDQTVTTTGIVTAAPGIYSGSYMFIEDPSGGPWNGIKAYKSGGFSITISEGDSVTVTGQVAEYYNETEIIATDVIVNSSGNPLPAPLILPTGAVSDEQNEGVLVKAENVTVTNPSLGYGEWEIDDISGACIVDDAGSYSYTPNLNDNLDFVIGVVFYTHSNYKIEPRYDADIGTPPPPIPSITIKEIQYTEDPSGDSPYVGEEVETIGVVTADFGYNGIFIEDPEGGAWSGIMLYKPTVYPDMGDLVKVKGIVKEYYNLTEIDKPTLEIISSYNEIPAPELLTSGEVSQEMWESVLVRVRNAEVIDPNLGHGEWEIDDTSGACIVDDMGYKYTPTLGERLTVIGPVYYSYENFKIEPRNKYDVTKIIPIYEIQGAGFESPYKDQIVETIGVVTADLQDESKNGFFIQDTAGDGNNQTSDGILVYEGPNTFQVNVGNLLLVKGKVKEYWNMTEMSLYPDGIEILETGVSIPSTIELSPPFDDVASDEYYEKIEGMLVNAPEAIVVGPTTRFGEFTVVREDLGIDRVYHIDDGEGERIIVDDEAGIQIQLKVGDKITGLYGPLDYTYDEYKIQQYSNDYTVSYDPDYPKPGDLDGDGDIDSNDAQILESRISEKNVPVGDPGDLNSDGKITGRDRAEINHIIKELTLKPFEYTIATFNVENLFDDIVDPGKLQTRDASSLFTAEEVDLKLTKLANAIHDDLNEPTILALQEVEKIELLQALISRPEIKISYEAVLIEGPDERGIDVALLYDTNKIEIISAEARNSCITLNDGFGPGQGDCPAGQNLLFSRPPLIVELKVLNFEEPSTFTNLTVIVNHFKSKSGGEEETLPRRIEQAKFVRGIVDEIFAENPETNLVVIGDLNDFIDSIPLDTLTETSSLENLNSLLNREDFYSFIFNGISEFLDYILITPGLENDLISYKAIHINADYPVPLLGEEDTTSRRSSDHDILLGKFTLLDKKK